MNSKLEIDEFSKLNNIELDVALYLCRNSNLKCKCGNYRKIKISSQSRVGFQLAITCGEKKCHPRFMIERPEHSRKMKEMALYKNSNFSKSHFKKGESNPRVNSIDFKKTILTKNNINFSDDTEIPEIYSKFLSESRKSSTYRGKQILIRYNKWEQYYKELIETALNVKPTEEWISTLTGDEIQSAWTLIHSINTLRNIKNGEKTGRNSFFKHEVLMNMQHNTQNLKEITFRSGWEYKLAIIFEKEGIPWSFEELQILSKDKQSFYIPDFVIMLNGIKTIIEVKGNFFNQDKEYYLKNKIQAGVDFAKEHNYNFYMLYKEPKTNFKEHLIDMRK